MLIVKRTICIALFIGLSSTLVFGQEAILTSGENASGSGGTVSYSVGQISYTTNSGTNGSVSEGVQQPYEMSIITAIELAKGIGLSFSAYPNPTTDFLTLTVENLDYTKFNFQLYNMNGELLENKLLTGEKTTISMQNLAPSSYFIKVVGDQEEYKTFKIIKH